MLTASCSLLSARYLEDCKYLSDLSDSPAYVAAAVPGSVLENPNPNNPIT